MMKYDLYLVGVGGQGVLTIGELLLEAARLVGLPANYYPTEGMAQRGGFVKAQVRIGQGVVGPNIPEKGADLVIAVEVSEALRAVRYIKPGGECVLYAHVWRPTAVMLGKAGYPALEQVCAEVTAAGARLVMLDPELLPEYEGLPIPYNLYTLGAAVGGTNLGNLLPQKAIREAICHRWPKDAERNRLAYEAGLLATQNRPHEEVIQPPRIVEGSPDRLDAPGEHKG
jgi:indolepyruvate ferredoxin oxidoreductase beta subunit